MKTANRITFLYLTQVKAVLFSIISATSYCRFLGSTPSKIAHGSYTQQLKYAKYRCLQNRSGNVFITKRHAW